jgi:hypothetical protein
MANSRPTANKPLPRYKVINLSKTIPKIVSDGFGSYLKWVAYCSRCKKNVVFTEPAYCVSNAKPTCEKGHQDKGDRLQIKIN